MTVKRPTYLDERRPRGRKPRAVAGPSVLISECLACKDAPTAAPLRTAPGYEIRDSGEVWRCGDEAGRGARLVMSSPMLPVRILTELADTEAASARVEIAYRHAGHWRTAIVDRVSLRSSRRLVDDLGNLDGSPVHTENAREVVQWIAAFEHANAELLPRAQYVTRTGYRTLGGRAAFVLGRTVHGHEGAVAVELSSRDDARALHAIGAAGEEPEQHETLRAAIGASRPIATAVYAALAAPLLRPLGAPNFGIHLVGRSSSGKTTAAQIAAGIYGRPEVSEEGFVSSWLATTVGLEHRAATLTDLPLILDEVGVLGDGPAREQAVYMLNSGRGKTRGARGGGIRETPTWRTVLISTGEREIADASSHAGAQVRVLQLHVDGSGVDAAQVNAWRACATRNHGHLGVRWIAKVVGMDAEALRADFQRIRAELQAGSRNGLESRQMEVVAILVLTEVLAHRELGIGSEVGATMRTWLDAEGLADRVAVLQEHVRGLEAVREWLSARPRSFPNISDSGPRGEHKTDDRDREVFGYQDEDFVYLLPGATEAELGRHGIALDIAARGWSDAGWLIPDGDGRRTTKIRIDGNRPRVYQLRREALNGADS